MTHGDAAAQSLLSAGPVPRPKDWLKMVRRVQTEAELSAVRRSIVRGVPFGGPRTTKGTIAELGLESSMQPQGRPRKDARSP